MVWGEFTSPAGRGTGGTDKISARFRDVSPTERVDMAEAVVEALEAGTVELNRGTVSESSKTRRAKHRRDTSRAVPRFEPLLSDAALTGRAASAERLLAAVSRVLGRLVGSPSSRAQPSVARAHPYPTPNPECRTKWPACLSPEFLAALLNTKPPMSSCEMGASIPAIPAVLGLPR
jgi:hypothetical protein